MKWKVQTWFSWIDKPMLLAAFLLLTSLVVLWQQPRAYSATPQAVFLPAAVKGGPAGLCRFSVNFLGDEDQYDIRPLRLGWYINYQANDNPMRPHGAEYAPIIDLEQTGPDAEDYVYTPSGQDLVDTIAGNPGAHWLIGNEPDRRYFQNDMEAHVYAHAYHELYYLIKAQDPTAKIVAGNIVQPTELRLQYLDMILDAYQAQFGAPLPADAWGAHNFILREARCGVIPDCWGADIPPGIPADTGELLDIEDNDNVEMFITRIERMRQWMADRGYRETSLFIDEYGVLMPEDLGFPPERVNTFMDATFDYMLSAVDPAIGNPYDGYRLVQRLSWYSSSDDPFTFNGRLWNPADGALTPVGQNYVDYVTPLPDVLDYYPVNLMVTPAAAPGQLTAGHLVAGHLAAGHLAALTLSSRVANQGNLLPRGHLVTRFYRGNPDSGGVQIGSDVTLPGPTGCGETSTAVVTWPNPAPGAHTIYVRVAAVGGVLETNAANNTYSQTITVP